MQNWVTDRLAVPGTNKSPKSDRCSVSFPTLSENQSLVLSKSLELHQLDGLASVFLPASGEFHYLLDSLVGMKGGVDEATSVRPVSYNEFINKIIHHAGILTYDSNQGDAIAKARLYERLQQITVRQRQQ